MKLLIDTHVFVWVATGDRRLSDPVKEALFDPDHEVFLSVVSRWEIVLKQRNLDFHLPEPFDRLMARSGYEPLDFSFDTPRIIEDLPDIHGDPFDRALVGQALLHEMTLVTRDKILLQYPVPTFW